MSSPAFTALAHRGVWDRYPENSLGAVRSALDAGFGVELDVRLTRDGVPVLNHDPYVASADGQRLAIDEHGLDELSAFPLGRSEEPVARLDDALALPGIGSTQVALHLKDGARPDTVERLLDAIPEAVLTNLFVFDISLELCAEFKELAPRLRVGVSVGDKKYHRYFYDLKDLASVPVDIVWADEYRHLYTFEFIEEARRMGKEVFAVSPDIAGLVGHPLAEAGYEASWEDLLRWGAAGICTDKPFELQSMIEERVG